MNFWVCIEQQQPKHSQNGSELYSIIPACIIRNLLNMKRVCQDCQIMKSITNPNYSSIICNIVFHTTSNEIQGVAIDNRRRQHYPTTEYLSSGFTKFNIHKYDNKSLQMFGCISSSLVTLLLTLLT